MADLIRRFLSQAPEHRSDGAQRDAVQPAAAHARVDIVLQSATKYLGGHGDLVAGVIVGSRESLALQIPTIIAMLLVALSGCDRVPQSSENSDVRVLATDLHVVATAESIAVVEDLAVLPDGTVWVLNSVEPFFVGFAPQGSILAAHGRAGGGPEEFGAPSGFVVGGLDGEAWVFDGRRPARTTERCGSGRWTSSAAACGAGRRGYESRPTAKCTKSDSRSASTRIVLAPNGSGACTGTSSMLPP